MRPILILAALCAALLFPPQPAVARTVYPLTVTDGIGRMVTIRQAPHAILLGSGFNLIALSLIHPDPVSLLSGWASDMKSDNPEIYARFRDKFPAIERLPLVSDGVTVSLEAALSVDADLVLLANWQAETDLGQQTIQVLEQAGMTVLVVDFNTDVVNATPRNMRLLGQVLDREEQANDYADFFEARMRRIRDRVAAHPRPPSGVVPRVFLDAFPNPDSCCYAYGRGGIGAFIELAGGQNAAEGLPSKGAPVSAEFVLTADPDVYIATGSPGERYSRFSVGPGVPRAEAEKGLEAAISTPLLSRVKAVREGRVHGIWNFFNAVPINLVAAEAVARWTRPDLFADLNPQATLEDINRRFAAVPFDGSYLVSLPAGTR